MPQRFDQTMRRRRSGGISIRMLARSHWYRQSHAESREGPARCHATRSTVKACRIRDDSAANTIKIPEAQRLILRLHLFNALNHTILGGIETNRCELAGSGESRRSRRRPRRTVGDIHSTSTNPKLLRSLLQKASNARWQGLSRIEYTQSSNPSPRPPESSIGARRDQPRDDVLTHPPCPQSGTQSENSRIAP